MEHMRGVASHDLHLVTWFKGHEANGAVVPENGLTKEVADNRFASVSQRSSEFWTAHISVASLLLLHFTRLDSHARQIAVVFELSEADLMVHEVVLSILLPMDVIIRDDAILEFGVIYNLTFFILIQLVALMAAACDNWEENEDWDSCKNKDDVLENVHEQARIEPASGLDFNFLVTFFYVLQVSLIVLDNIQGITKDATFDNPLTKGPWSEASILARLLKDARAEDVVEIPEKAQSSGSTREIDAET